MMKRPSPNLPNSTSIDPFRHALAYLLEAHAFAAMLNRSDDDFACQISNLKDSGISESVLRSLFHEGLIEHRWETTHLNQQRRTFRVKTNTRFADSSCFILTAKGLSLADRQKGTSYVSGKNGKMYDVPWYVAFLTKK
jgi:hypothetical protein